MNETTHYSPPTLVKRARLTTIVAEAVSGPTPA
jgi:hypothetical protein